MDHRANHPFARWFLEPLLLLFLLVDTKRYNLRYNERESIDVKEKSEGCDVIKD